MTNYVELAQARLERMKKRVYKTATPRIPGKKYSYVFGFTDLGKPILWGPYEDDEEANRNAVGLDTYEIFHLETVNMQKASSEVRGILIRRGEDPDAVMKRLIHKPLMASKEKPNKRLISRLW